MTTGDGRVRGSVLLISEEQVGWFSREGGGDSVSAECGVGRTRGKISQKGDWKESERSEWWVERSVDGLGGRRSEGERWERDETRDKR